MADDNNTEFHELCLMDFDRIIAKVQEEREQCLKDRRFVSVAGAQWEGAVGEQFANKIKLEVNKVQLGVLRIENEYLNNKITVDFVPSPGSGEEGEILADSCDDLYRADEQDSQAEESYDNAFGEAVNGGMGAWRLSTEYEDEEDPDNEHQRIRFKPIYDADSCVFFDIGSRLPDKSDAKRCYILSAISIDDYKDKYDGSDPATWPKPIDNSEFDWASDDEIYLAEVYQVEYVFTEYKYFQHLNGDIEKYSTEELEEDLETQQVLLAVGAKEIKTRNIKRKRIHKYLMSGEKILKDYGYIAGCEIPIIVTYGKRRIIDGIERCQGHVRITKDSQRLKNMQISKLGEISAASSYKKPIFTTEQVAGYESYWANDGVENYPYLLINLIDNTTGDGTVAGPLGYLEPPDIPQPLATLLQLTETDIKELLGNQEQGEVILPNLSGKAVELVQNKLDMQSFIYMSNFKKAIQRCGTIWLGMARDIYVEDGRKMQGRTAEGKDTTIELNRPVQGASKEVIYSNDMKKAKFKVYADVGPSSNTRRQSIIRVLLSTLQYTTDPETIGIVNSLIMMNLEGEGVSDTRQYFRMKLVRMGVLKPTEEEKQVLDQERENAKPDANTVYLEAAARNEDAKAQKAGADTIKTLTDAERNQAETLKTLDEVDNPQRAKTIQASIQKDEKGVSP